MPAGPGESLLSTVFADVHYHFNDPASKPPHHRFDRGSYVYLYYNAVQRQTKLEIANHAGTPEQDAFFGYLNVANVRWTHLQPNLITLLINTSAVPDQSTWHLPTFDPRHEQKYMYKLHALDIYMWTEKDAATLWGHLRSVLSQDRLEIKDATGVNTPHSEHRDSMSPVVQQLEKTAIASHFPPRAASAVSAQSLPGLPTPAMSAGGSPKVAPGGYNPAAPAAPEPIAYREKTPPPPDDGTGTGLARAAKYDSAPQPQYAQATGIYQSSNQTTPQHAYFGGPPQLQSQPSHHSTHSQSSIPGPPGSVPPPPQQQKAPSFGPMAQSTLPTSPPPGQQNFNRQSSFGPTAQSTIPQTQYANYNPQAQYGNQPATPGDNAQLPPTPSAPPAYSGPLQSPGLPPPPPQQQQTPVGGYSNYNYTTAGAAPSSISYGGYTGDIHNTAYRPTEAEASSHGHGHAKPARQATGGQPGQPTKLQSHVGKGEAKVSKFLNKLDKLW
ncbi:hypothetical protein CLAFUW4_01436 [Fulvia fulva]|uniref:Uncharacterized protein n=1 Tax=Passalora fulva TaxID=5499 RepID=A0A9Q8P3K3_PASFU|nr:uncharacterized protein CLAFUR5_01438 [Fulvia fulva]KAK4636158.1 hypothetical protein CLAFUR4_01437 [Fulvia fulva]KAK4637173.1 hypothetical protein CLAFUR0_01438 [Fulvia fulva]UJO11851.1 hypothetical protein CLAFUR5_01438 [Fulvia fulva]WPV10355.1 hypothetical protein CLAFUW4_01436 [Fulvia fulva]WPV24132.1 hypothetical protein CLAFUW7_01441 [Fulvia fulva]